MGPGTIIPNLTRDQLDDRLVQLFPIPWTSDSAKIPGGILRSLLSAMFGQPNYLIMQGILFAWEGTRIATAVGSGLDTISQDFFGPGLPRLMGETDDAFRLRIQQNLLRPMVTRSSIYNALLELTGTPPRMIEPWNPGDTCEWDGNSYYDIDELQCPFLWGDPALHYQGAIQAGTTLQTLTGGASVWGWDAGWAFDTPQNAWFDILTALNLSSESFAEELIAGYKAEGTVIWIKFTIPALEIVIGYVGFLQGGFTATQLSSIRLPFISGKAFVMILGLPTWVGPMWVDNISSLSTVFESNLPVPAGLTLPWTAYGLASPLAQLVWVPQKAVSVTVIPPGGIPAGHIPLATPTWNTNVYVTSLTGSQVVFGFSTPAQGLAYLNVSMVVPGTATPVPAGSNKLTITGPGLIPPYFASGILNWNASVRVLTYSLNQFTVEFSAPAPNDNSGVFYWAVQEST